MSAKYAVLGLVLERPGHGYQLAQRLEDRCGGQLWTRPNVYSTLDRLVEDGYVCVVGTRSRPTELTGRNAPRTIYGPTSIGRDAFSAWMSSSSRSKPARDELDLKLLFSSPDYLPDLLDQVRTQEQLCVVALAELKRPASVVPQDPASAWKDAVVLLEREGEIKRLEARVEWLQLVRETMREMVARGG